MNSFKNAVYSSVKVKDKEGAYTQDDINDNLPDGYYKYYRYTEVEQNVAYITAFFAQKYTRPFLFFYKRV